MSITPRNGSWQAVVYHAGKRYRKTAPTRDEALRWEAGARVRSLDGLEPIVNDRGPSVANTLRQLRDLTYRLAWAGTRGEDTAVSNSDSVLEILGPDTMVEAIDGSLIHKLVLGCKAAGNSGATINRKLAALSKMLSVAVDQGILKTKPAVRREKEGEHRTRFLSVAEERALFEAIGKRDAELRQLCVFLVETGVRVSEALNLRWSDVNGSAVWVRHTKADRPRMIPLTQSASEILLRQAGKETPFGHISQARLNHVWTQAKKDAGLGGDKEVVPHCLRHTCASRLIQGGADVLTVQKWLGHRSLVMTMRYAHLSTRQLTGARDVLDAFRK